MYQLLFCLLLIFTSLSAEKANPSFSFEISKNKIFSDDELGPEVKTVTIGITQLKDDKEINMVLRRPLCQSIEKKFFKTSLPVYKIEEDNHLDVVLMLKGYFFGEKVYIDWNSKNDSGTFSFTPFPLVFKSPEGITARVELVDAVTSCYLIRLNGFKVGEEVKMTSKAYDETIIRNMKVCIDQPIIYLPEVKGYSEGFGTITFENNIGKKLLIKLPFGKSIQDARVKGSL